MLMADIRNSLRNIKQYFNLMADKEDEREVVEQVSAGVVFRGTNLWILIFAILIASLGLNVNSTAVIIGAMLVSPLMGPIIGMGLSVGIGDFDLLRRALKNYAVATLISIVTATVYFLISPLGEARSELLARTSPTLYDVLIAFCGGAAGVLALTTKSKGQVIPGVAIATALMPPLCTAGYGLATAQWSYFLGAFYLFFINTVFIAVATFLGVKLLRFHRVGQTSPERMRYGRRVMTVVLVVTMLPAAVMTWNIVRDNIFQRNVQSFVSHELQQSGTQILSQQVEHDTLRVVAVGRTISDEELDEARRRMGGYKLRGLELSVIQGTDYAGVAAQISRRMTTADAENARLTGQVDSLRRQLAAYNGLDSLAAQLNNEAAAIFPQQWQVGLGVAGGSRLALVKGGGKPASNAERQRLEEWLRARMADPDMAVVFVQ
ncbi:MAG: DUF389 domain-containing protein [Bacteroidales bacterium]|nr:DUF389 domain-containing protein [Bacteroidales bacterium]